MECPSGLSDGQKPGRFVPITIKKLNIPYEYGHKIYIAELSLDDVSIDITTYSISEDNSVKEDIKTIIPKTGIPGYYYENSLSG